MVRPPETCPICGVDVPRNARACSGCGADENTGWAEEVQQATAAELGLPEEKFDYDEFAKREFGNDPVKPRGLHWIWWVVGIVLLVAIVISYIR